MGVRAGSICGTDKGEIRVLGHRLAHMTSRTRMRVIPPKELKSFVAGTMYWWILVLARVWK